MNEKFNENLLIRGTLSAFDEVVDSKTKRYVVNSPDYVTKVCDLVGTMLLLRANPHTSTIEINGDYYEKSSFPILSYMTELMSSAEIYLSEYSIDRAKPISKACFNAEEFKPTSAKADYQFKPMTPQQIKTFVKDLKLDDKALTTIPAFTPITVADLNCVCENLSLDWFKMGGAMDEVPSTLINLTLPRLLTGHLVSTYPASTEEVKKWILRSICVN